MAAESGEALSMDRWLFSYGTLRSAAVQRAVFGRTLTGVPDALTGFTLDTITIADPASVAVSGMAEHLILRRTPDGSGRIDGVALAITDEDLPHADAYEAEDYARIAVRLASGRQAFVYVEPGATG